jgi:hypothetical protein
VVHLVQVVAEQHEMVPCLRVVEEKMADLCDRKAVMHDFCSVLVRNLELESENVLTMVIYQSHVESLDHQVTTAIDLDRVADLETCQMDEKRAMDFAYAYQTSKMVLEEYAACHASVEAVIDRQLVALDLERTVAEVAVEVASCNHHVVESQWIADQLAFRVEQMTMSCQIHLKQHFQQQK